MGRTHAVPEQDDDVFDLLATNAQGHDFKVTLGEHALTITLLGFDAQGVHARRAHTEGAGGGNGCISGDLW